MQIRLKSYPKTSFRWREKLRWSKEVKTELIIFFCTPWTCWVLGISWKRKSFRILSMVQRYRLNTQSRSFGLVRRCLLSELTLLNLWIPELFFCNPWNSDFYLFMSKYNTSFSFKDTIPGDALIIEMCPTLQTSDSNISGS